MLGSWSCCELDALSLACLLRQVQEEGRSKAAVAIEGDAKLVCRLTGLTEEAQ
jgi:ubiquinone biosynthesis protein UbiJ